MDKSKRLKKLFKKYECKIGPEDTDRIMESFRSWMPVRNSAVRVIVPSDGCIGLNVDTRV